ncbi:MAG: type II toxin-antitoxin system VapC family toxin [Rhodocyclaceae bacterium]|nr:type II toxin-antitoxin system VapC family toxin [Rhodocyclaceae bacterium]
MSFVLDASASVGWCIDNQATEYSEAVGRALEVDSAFVPSLWQLEMANALRNACKRQVLDIAGAQGFLAKLDTLPIRIDSAQPKVSEILALALRHDLTSYDAAYLDLALRLQLPIATQDAALREAALASGVGLWKPG